LSAATREGRRGAPSKIVRRARASVLAAIAVLALAIPVARGDEFAAEQPPSVIGRDDLNFADVVAGVPMSIARKDAHRAGTFWIRGNANAVVLLTLALPSFLGGPAGARLPITFGSDDAGFSRQQQPGQAIGFNPALPRIAQLGNNGHGWVFLGGTVRPAMGQRAGSYLGTVVLTVAFVGQ